MLSVSVIWAQQNTVGKRKAETSEASGGLERNVRLWLRAAKQRARKHEHSPIPSPLTPPLENATHDNHVCNSVVNKFAISW